MKGFTLGAILPTLLLINAAGARQPITITKAEPQRRTEETRTQTRSTGSITGRVITDQGQPLGNAAVYATPLGASSTSTTRRTTTDEAGHFEIQGLAAGVYSLRVSRPGYLADPAQRERNYYRIGETAEITMFKGGVITGTVTNAAGEPMVAARVRAWRVRDAQARPVSTGQINEAISDDRGVYRIYGLEPGWHVVLAGGGGRELAISAHDDSVPTYHPSSTRDTATLVLTQGGSEASGIDIRCRDGRGHAVSGRISGALPSGSSNRAITVTLARAASGEAEAMLTAFPRDGLSAFGFYGVSDGEYEVLAYSGLGTEESAASEPQGVKVKGSDVTGVELTLARLGSLAGRVVIEAARDTERKLACGDKPGGASLGEVVIIARRDEKDARTDSLRLILPLTASSAPNEKSEFVISSLLAGRYRVETQLPNNGWYAKAMSLPSTTQTARSTAAGRASDAAREGVIVKPGERVRGLTVTLASGAAGLQGRVISAAEGAPLPVSLRVHLVPAERESADDVLRFAETLAQSDGTFTFRNIPPGRYWLMAKPGGDQSSERTYRPAVWDSDKRAALRREAENGDAVIELQPCQRVSDHQLRFSSESAGSRKDVKNR
jgi:protocatechuate 3,4-dioxygenase beta subunit